MADVDLTVAESAYATLLDARHKPRNVAATPRFGRPARFKASAGHQYLGSVVASTK